MPLVENDTPAISPKFTDLPISEQFVLWAARIWVTSNQNAPTLHLNLRNGFRATNMDDGYLILDRIMTLLSTQASKKIYLHCACLTGITEHEHAFLGIIAEFQTGDESSAHMVLSEWLPPPAARSRASRRGESGRDRGRTTGVVALRATIVRRRGLS